MKYLKILNLFAGLVGRHYFWSSFALDRINTPDLESK